MGQLEITLWFLFAVAAICAYIFMARRAGLAGVFLVSVFILAVMILAGMLGWR